MISFLLGLLKIIGIILLVLLVLLLLLIGIVLFVPIRYLGQGKITDEQKNANVKVTWLLKSVRFKLDYTYPQKPSIMLKILRIDILKFFNKPKKEKKIKKEKQQEKKSVNTTLVSETDTVASGKQEFSSIATDTTQVEKAEEISQNEEITKKESFREKIEKIIFKITSLYDKIRSVKDNIDYYWGILQDRDTKLLISNAWTSIKKILKSIRPKIFDLKGEFGFDTPDTTGKVYGYYCMAMPWISKYICLEPNFEQKIVKGNFYFKGKITIFIILVNVLRIIFDKRLQPLIKKLKNGGKKDGR